MAEAARLRKRQCLFNVRVASKASAADIVATLREAKEHRELLQELTRPQIDAAFKATRAGEFDRRQTALGIKFNPHGLLWNEKLRDHIPILEALLWDGMYCLFSDGECHTELSLLLPRLEKTSFKITFAKIHAYMRADWRTPSAWGLLPNVADAFNTERTDHWKRCGSFGGNAGEMVSIMPLFAFMLQTVRGETSSLHAEIPEVCRGLVGVTSAHHMPIWQNMETEQV